MDNIKDESAFVNRRRQHTTWIRNQAIHDESISLKAKGLLVLMLSFGEKTNFNMDEVAALSKNGKHSTLSAMNELVEAGYIIKYRVRGSSGQYVGISYDVTDYKQGVADG